ncbi:MAG: EAL domain-containing response regulator [Steroidobacteraceae bacterium]|jgi:EAL domain-containing protein (putative c-di-GMP-specific phosphodiesterase class I)/FixJ family two-component response regulator
MNSLDPKTAGIVLLDDDPFMLKLMTHMLAQLGYTHVVACDGGSKALQYLNDPHEVVDLIFLDINMPGMDGVEFIRRLVDRRYAGSVILVSGENNRILESVEKLIEAHRLIALGHLQKPVKPEELARLLGQLKPRVGGRGRTPRVSRQSYTAEHLHAAIHEGQLVNYYQPKVALATREVVGFESLVRWQHPSDGLIAPDQFIGLAAQHGLITALTEVVLGMAMSQARDWSRAGHQIPIAVNVSMDDLTALDFPDRAADLAAAIGVEPQLITLEVTEGQVMRQLSTVLDVLSRLSLKRFRLAIDDFGTGHSSLAQLRDLPFDELKIDRGFVHGALTDGTRRAICSASLRMAHQLQMQVVGEGIEDVDDWEFLAHLGCDVGQGYYMARPMPAAEVQIWLEGWGAHSHDSAPHTAVPRAQD